MKVKKASSLGFCSGVRVADKRVKRFADSGGKGAILGQVVHNERVVEEMEELGVRTVDKLEEVEEPVIVFSAHGVPPSCHKRAKRLGLEILDTTCKFVYDIHREVEKALDDGSHLVFIGDPHHREVIGYTNDLEKDRYHVIQTMKQAEAVDWSTYESIKVLYQTTLNADQFEAVVRFIESHNESVTRAKTICYATKRHQEAARALAADPQVETVVVIGGRHSANTHHLYEICKQLKSSHLIQGVSDIDPSWFAGMSCIGITAGASTPDYVVGEVEEFIKNL